MRYALLRNRRIKKGIKNSKIKIFKNYDYNTEPTKLTKQIEEIKQFDPVKVEYKYLNREKGLT